MPNFAQATLAQVVVDALRYYHGRSVDVLAYCVMPDHVHLLVRMLQPATALSRWVGDFKRWVGRNAREQHLATLRWQPGFYERVVRGSEDLVGVARYVVGNPVRAGLTDDWRSYPWSGSFVYEL
jgi:REP element-mobilizing transposase RayT